MQLLLWPLSKGRCGDKILGHVGMFSKLDEGLHKYKMMVFFLLWEIRLEMKTGAR